MLLVLIILLSSSPCTSLVVKATILGLWRCNIASTVACMVAVMVTFMVAGFPGLIVTKLILGFLVLFIISNGERLVQVVCLIFVDVVDAVRVISFSHFFPCTFFVGVCFTTILSVLTKLIHGRQNLHEMLLLNLVPAGSTFFASSDTFNLFCFVIFHNQINQLAAV
jgi:hypothetical protein